MLYRKPDTMTKIKEVCFWVSKHVKKKCKASLLISDMDISRPMVYMPNR